MTVIANDAWRTTNAMCKINIEPIRKGKNDNDLLSDTVSMHSGSDSQYTVVNDPKQIFIEKTNNEKSEIKQEVLEEDEVMSMDIDYDLILKEEEESQSPVAHSTEGENRINHPTTRISEEDERKTSRKTDTDTSEDISKLPELPEDDDQGQPNGSHRKKELTCKTKENGYVTKRNKRNCSERNEKLKSAPALACSATEDRRPIGARAGSAGR